MHKESNHLLDNLMSGSYYQYILDHLQESLVVIDADYVIVDANDIFTSQFKTDSVIGKKCYEATHGYSKPCHECGVKCPLVEVMQNGVPQEVVHEHKYGDTVVWENIVAYPLRDKHGHIGFIVETIRDVTELYKTQESLKSTVTGIIHILSNASELRDPYTAGHQRRVAQLSIAIALELGAQREAEEVVGLAAQIHDIGKISIPVELLAKPTRLSQPEFDLIKKHPIAGYEILTGVEFGAPIAEIILQHHENIDGSGYPYGITGAEMLEEAKILRVADTVEAMASHRPYRAGLGNDAALKEISDNKGVIYDADVVDACLRVFKKGGFEFV